MCTEIHKYFKDVFFFYVKQLKFIVLAYSKGALKFYICAVRVVSIFIVHSFRGVVKFFLPHPDPKSCSPCNKWLLPYMCETCILQMFYMCMNYMCNTPKHHICETHVPHLLEYIWQLWIFKFVSSTRGICDKVVKHTWRGQF